MNWKDYKLSHLVVASCVTLAVLLAGQYLWHNYAVAKPLGKALDNINGVENAVWQKKSGNSESVTIDITLKNAANFAATYKELNETAAQMLGHNKFQIKIHDHRTPELEQLYYDLHVYLQEAIATGNFSLMQERVRTAAARQGATATVYVDTDSLYLTLAKGNDDMYVLIPRQSTGEEKNHASY